MKNLFSAIIFFGCVSAFAHDHNNVKESRIGEYYEFDTEGTKGDRVGRQLRHCTCKTITAPFRSIRFCYRKTKHLLRAARNNAETVLMNDAAHIDGHSKIREVLDNWEMSPDTKEIIENDREAGSNCMFGLPQGAWKLLKSALHTAGFKFPRAVWRTIRSFGRGSADCAGI